MGKKSVLFHEMFMLWTVNAPQRGTDTYQLAYNFPNETLQCQEHFFFYSTGE